MTDDNICFVIAPIGDEESDIRERSDKLFNYVIEPAVSPHGFEPIRADHIAEPGIITSQVIEHVVECPLVVADLTGSNANVFYELAVRHAIQKPLIQLIRSDETIPFDVAGTRTIQIDLSDIESAEVAKEKIGDQIETITVDEQDMDTPISVALDLRRLRESTDPEERSMADIMESITELRNSLVSINNQLEHPEEILPPDYIRQVTEQLGSSRTEEEKMLIDRTQYEVGKIKEALSEDRSFQHPDLVNRLEQVHKNLNYLKHDPRIPVQPGLADFSEFD